MTESFVKDPIEWARTHLVPLRAEDWVRLSLFSAMCGLVFVLFHFQGVTDVGYDIATTTRSAFVWLIGRWKGDEDMSHGFIIPFVSLGVIWYKRREFADAPKSINLLGLGVVVMALMMHWAGVAAQQTRLSLLGLDFLFWGIPFFLFGWPVAKLLIFPCAYLLFCLPWNFIENMTFPLRLISTIMSAGILNGMGLEVTRSGTALYSQMGQGFSLDVAEPCSGIRSMMAMTALTAVYAYLTQKTLLKKWLLFLSCIPIALIGNFTRIVGVAIAAQIFGQEVATGFYHDYSGYVFFAVAIVLMCSIAHLLSLDWGGVVRHYKAQLMMETTG